MVLTRDPIHKHALTARSRMPAVSVTDTALELASQTSERYRISSTQALVNTCRKLAEVDEISVAVLGRFKAGKSSFLNHFLGRDLLPVGVIPVTAIITEIGYGPIETAEVHHLDGNIRRVPVEAVRDFVAESENPENVKQVERVSIDLPALQRFEGLRFVDTPGLESALAHNTQASRDWLPNAGLALVAMSVDPPLSEQDISLIKSLYDYTPNVSLLVTKTDVLRPEDRTEVLNYVRTQLSKRLDKIPDIFPYSTQPGFEHLKTAIEHKLVNGTLASFNQERTAILQRKTDTLLRECEDYLKLALRAAETQDSAREQLDRVASAEREAIADVKSEFHLIVRDAAAGTRSRVAASLEKFQLSLERELTASLQSEFPKWTASLAFALDSYQDWLRREIAERLSEISLTLRPEFTKPLQKTSRQILRSLQAFRDRLSERTERVFGIPLRTTEPDIDPESPKAPDVRIERIFDRNWELLSAVIPMRLVRGIVLAHFRKTLSFLVFANLSRLATQWEESINTALFGMEKEAAKRIDDLLATVESLLSTDNSDAAQIREDLARIAEVRDKITGQAV